MGTRDQWDHGTSGNTGPVGTRVQWELEVNRNIGSVQKWISRNRGSPILLPRDDKMSFRRHKKKLFLIVHRAYFYPERVSLNYPLGELFFSSDILDTYNTK